MTLSRVIPLPLALLVPLALLLPAPATAGVLGDGANRLVQLQADITGDNAGNGLNDIDPDDGGWDWTLLPADSAHSAVSSPENLYGATAGGLLEAFIAEGGIRTAIGLLDTWSGILANPNVHVGADYAFLVRLSRLTGDATYATEARPRWDTRIAGSGGADSLAMEIRDSRHAQGWDALIPWDIGLHIESAMELESYFPGQGYLTDAVDMAGIVYGDITSPTPYFDMDNDTLPAYYLGLEGVLVSFGLTDVYTSYAMDAGRRLILAQNPNGSWPWSQPYLQPNLQTTAYVLMGFGMLNLPYGVVDRAAQAGSAYLVSMQRPNGGWSSVGTEYPEVDGECLRAISYYPPALGLSDPRIGADHHPGGELDRGEGQPIVHPWTH